MLRCREPGRRSTAQTRGLLALLSVCAGLGCRLPGGSSAAPTGRLPTDVVPRHYDLVLEIDPARERFRGWVAIEVELDRARRTLWLHGLDLDIERARVVPRGGEPREARVGLAHESGVLAVELARELGPGSATIEIEWSAAFGRGLRGLYRVDRGQDRYAFTQFEPISARAAFPCFDEPAFKTPFDLRLRTPEGLEALTSTPELERALLADGFVERRFAATPPLPTYLIAFAVGPLDRVDVGSLPPGPLRARPLPLRGFATRGRGAELAFALASTGPILEALERYFGSGYPFAKLDLVAVPDFGAGAMENVGLVTFRDWLLLVDGETAPVYQRRASVSVMAHELAHMWFGNLVTMPWWDDLWLNEALATWLAQRTIAELYPEHRSPQSSLAATHYAMRADSLVSARRIRQPIASNHDISSAFDSITYSKGGAVLSMFEGWLGPERFRSVIRRTIEGHRFGSAGADALLDEIAVEGGPELAAAFRGFLDRPGLPFVSARLECRSGESSLELVQSRYLPLGSGADATARAQRWSIPLCVRVGRGAKSERRCTLLADGSAGSAQAQRLELGAPCVDWVHPNADAAGYYRWSLDDAALRQLLDRGLAASSTLERIALADALTAAFDSGATTSESVLASLAALAGDAERAVATAPIGLLEFAWQHLATSGRERESVAAFAGALYTERARSLGFEAALDEDGETRLLRAELMDVAVTRVRERALRSEAASRGRRYLGLEPTGADALSPDAAAAELLDLVVSVAVEDGGGEAFEAALAHLFASDDAAVRRRMLNAAAHASDPALAERARALALDSRLRENEVLVVLGVQAELPERRNEAWSWLLAHYSGLLERLTPSRGAGLLGIAAGFCSEQAARGVEARFGSRVHGLEGGPRRLATTLETIRLCAARAAFHREAAMGFFAMQEHAVRGPRTEAAVGVDAIASSSGGMQ